MKIALTEFVTLDGVSQGPGSPAEDTSDGFTRGGWLVPYLDDLFVDPSQRGQRVADALIEAVAEEGRRRGWSVIRWITADDNYRGRGVYDRLATRTMWITYDKKLG